MGTQEEKSSRAIHLLLCRLCMTLVIVVLFPMSLQAQAPLMTTNAIYRTFHIKWGTSTGTAFVIDRASKQYLVTARHVVKGIESGKAIKLLHERKWKNLTVDVVGIGKSEIDVAVLACSIPLSPSYSLIASGAHLGYGQSISFLGYPFGWDGGGEQINRGIPLPFVKAGVVSALEFGDVSKIYLDAHGNRGFSGGPVVFVPNGRPRNELRVAGIISYYPQPRSSWQPVVDSDGNPLTNPAGEPMGYVQENPGIVVAIGIRHAVELIDANPIGFQLPTDKDG